jgi:hypothetical protein
MKVARHEIPGNRARRSPSRRVRYDRLSKASYRLARWTTPAARGHTVPYGTDHICRASRHFMPGYHRLVPTGQIHPRPFVEVREQSGGRPRPNRSYPIPQYSALQDSRTACPTKPKLYIADRSSRPRKRGTLHSQDAGEVGRTTTRTSTTGPVRLTEPVCIGQLQNLGN